MDFYRIDFNLGIAVRCRNRGKEKRQTRYAGTILFYDDHIAFADSITALTINKPEIDFSYLL
tara:strand:- start:612 stop:797 length:186 start_codon:yes stop_codon:yes gene_type:complete